jgi:hypothetical protein
MSADGIVNAVGVVLGNVQDSLGVGGATNANFLLSAGSSRPTFVAASFGSGQTASASNSQSGGLNALFAALGEQDLAAHANLQGALTSQAAGHGQMNDVISATLGDVTGLAPGTNTNGGLLALVSALAGRLEQAWQVLTTGSTDASTHAAGSAQVAAGYNSLTGAPSGGVAPAGALSSMGGLSTGAPSTAAPMSGMVPMQVWLPASAAAASTAAGAASAAGQAANTQQHPTPTAHTPTPAPTGQRKRDPLHINTVTNDMKQGVGTAGKTAATGYINKALDIMGITDPKARANWMTGLLHGMLMESSYNPSALNHTPTYSTTVMLSDGAKISCARGILQNIPTTFAANHQYGTSTNIYDPVANICSTMWYVNGRYHVSWDGSNLSSIAAFRPGSPDPGY